MVANGGARKERKIDSQELVRESINLQALDFEEKLIDILGVS